MNLDDAEERQIAAADYVLGRVRGADRAYFEDRLELDPSLRRLVEEWRMRLSAEARPPEHPRIPLDPPVGDAAVPQPAVRAMSEVPPLPKARVETSSDAGQVYRLQRRLEAWRMLAFAGAVTAAGFAFFLFGQSPLRFADREGPVFIAVLVPADRIGGAWLVRMEGGPLPRVSATPVAEAVPEAVPVGDGFLHLWALPGDGSPPLWLGEVASGARGALGWPESAAIRPGVGVGLMMSLEPADGAANGGPAGPVMFEGELVAASPD